MAKRPTRLRFTEDDLSSDAVKKAAGKAEKAAAKAEKAVDKITPKKHRKLRQEADVSASRTAKLRFGKAKADDIPPKPSGIKRTVTHAPVDIPMFGVVLPLLPVLIVLDSSAGSSITAAMDGVSADKLRTGLKTSVILFRLLKQNQEI